MVNAKPRIFVGSSREAIDTVYALQELLSDDAEVIPWRHADFELSKTFIENIESELAKSDFGIFIFSGDDQVIFRGETTLGIRDNVLFEFGLFSGVLGRNRVFIVAPSDFGKGIRTPSDLLGMTVATYDKSSTDLKIALGKAANLIRREIKKSKKRVGIQLIRSQRIEGVLGRGGTEYINILADAALYVGDHRHEYSQELKRRLKSKEIIPMKYLYRTEQASNHWLSICKRESYHFYRNSLSLLRTKASEIVSVIVSSIGDREIDLVSIGSGNGEKDNILIREFIKDLRDEEYIYYYPLDISDTLIEEAVKNSTGKGIQKSRIKTRALLADFTQLLELQKIYEERSSNNVFSILGNTIGNADEANLISSIADSMLAGDIVLIEINVGQIDEHDPMLREIDNLHHDFAPLASLGIPFNDELLTYSQIAGQSIVPDTSSLLATYTEALIDGDIVNNVKLSIIHHYQFNKFRETIQNRMNVNIIFECEQDGVGIFIAQRKKDDR